jgi:sialate O-acetylesterase
LSYLPVQSPATPRPSDRRGTFYFKTKPTHEDPTKALVVFDPPRLDNPRNPKGSLTMKRTTPRLFPKPDTLVPALILPLMLLLAFAPVTRAQSDDASALRFAGILGDEMVLQQQKPAQVWGWAKPGSEVVVTITQDRAAAEPYLQEQRRGEPAVSVQYKQKNPPAFKAQTLKARAGDDGRWSVAFDAMPASFTPKYIVAKQGDHAVAIGDVLVGEVWVCAGQSNMGWTTFNRDDREKPSADFPALRYVAWNDSWYKPLDDVRKRVNWQPCTPGTVKNFSSVPYLYGRYLQRYLKVPVGIINVARGGTLGQTWAMRSELESIDNKVINTVLADYDAQTAVWDDPKQVEALMAQWEKAKAKARADHAEAVKKAKAQGKREPRLRLPKQPEDPRSGWSPPAGLFNATVMPIRDLNIKGVLYYQGENQAFNVWTRYEYTFPKVPASFRKAFGDDTLPFGCISQPGWGQFGLDPEIATVTNAYPIVRDIQRRALKDDKHAGMIATYPTGNSYIHPGEKLPVAEYASLWALATVYGENIPHRGNQYESMKVVDDKLYVFFDIDPVVYDRWKHIENNASWQVLPQPYQGNAPIQGFIIADENKRWYPATAREVRLDGRWCIELTSDLVDKPVAARYGWANWPTGNLVGRENLPVPTFRTDDWPLPEAYKYDEQAGQAAQAKRNAMKEQGEKHALDRKIRQAQIDLPRYENELYKGNAQQQVKSKLDRMQAILDEMENDRWLSNQLDREDELTKQLDALRKQIDKARAEAEQAW